MYWLRDIRKRGQKNKSNRKKSPHFTSVKCSKKLNVTQTLKIFNPIAIDVQMIFFTPEKLHFLYCSLSLCEEFIMEDLI